MGNSPDESADFTGPLGLASFDLGNSCGRQDFLRKFCSIGEPALLEAVSHIWTLLNEPRAMRCTLMGIGAGTGGQGKVALVHLLRACLEEVIAVGHPLPPPAKFASLEDWHWACMAAFEAEDARERSVFERYSAILGGDCPLSACKSAQVIHGPWKQPKSAAPLSSSSQGTNGELDLRRRRTSSSTELE